jgi:hypothetical protein
MARFRRPLSGNRQIEEGLDRYWRENNTPSGAKISLPGFGGARRNLSGSALFLLVVLGFFELCGFFQGEADNAFIRRFRVLFRLFHHILRYPAAFIGIFTSGKNLFLNRSGYYVFFHRTA